MCSSTTTNNKNNLQVVGGKAMENVMAGGGGDCENAPERRTTAEKCRQTQILRHNFIFLLSHFFVALFFINFHRFLPAFPEDTNTHTHQRT